MKFNFRSAFLLTALSSLATACGSSGSGVPEEILNEGNIENTTNTTAEYGYPVIASRQLFHNNLSDAYNPYWHDFNVVYPLADNFDLDTEAQGLRDEILLLDPMLNGYASNIYTTIESGLESSADSLQLSRDITFHEKFKRICNPQLVGGVLVDYDCEGNRGVYFYYTPLGGGVLPVKMIERSSETGTISFQIGGGQLQPLFGYSVFHEVTYVPGDRISTHTGNPIPGDSEGSAFWYFDNTRNDSSSLNELTAILRSSRIAIRGVRTATY